MKILFEKCTNVKRYDSEYYCAMYDDGTTAFDAARLILLCDILKDQFISIKFERISLYCIFNFREQADEAGFLLWSSDGIEI